MSSLRLPLTITLFAHVCSRSETDLDLAEAALLIGEIVHPGLDVAHYMKALDELGNGARAAVAKAEAAGELDVEEEAEARLEQALGWLYGEAGFHGNQEDYYDPRNSFLNEVIDRRTGIPISLAVVLTEVCRRAGIAVNGVSFPGHFLGRSESPRGYLLIDPFTGRILTREEVQVLYSRTTRDPGEPPAHLLDPAPKHQILLRMLNNLRSIYTARADIEHLRGVLERMHVLAPSNELRREIEKVGGSTFWPSGDRSVN